MLQHLISSSTQIRVSSTFDPCYGLQEADTPGSALSS